MNSVSHVNYTITSSVLSNLIRLFFLVTFAEILTTVRIINISRMESCSDSATRLSSGTRLKACRTLNGHLNREKRPTMKGGDARKGQLSKRDGIWLQGVPIGTGSSE